MRAQAKQLRRHLISGAVLAALIISLVWFYLAHHTIAVMQPVGPIGAGERQILIVSFLLMLTIVIPVFALLFTIAWRYRDTNKRRHRYQPNLDGNRTLELTWWAIPSLLIAALAVITWHGTFKYDPYQPVSAEAKSLTVQAVAENGWWLFLYPEQHVASVNRLPLPVGQAVHFQITADAPMNSLWIPQLGGQMYAMPGMVSQLNLRADKTGSYRGVSANISGKDFAKMHFQADVSSRATFNTWVRQAAGGGCLNYDAYGDMRRQDLADTQAAYQLEHGLFEQITAQYMPAMNGMDHSAMVQSMAPQSFVSDEAVCRA